MLRLFCLITVLGLAAAYDSTGTNTNPFDDTSTDTTNTGGDTTDTGDTGDVGVTLSMQFPELAFYGFEPVVNLEARRNRSNPDLFDRDYQSIGFDLRSSF